MKIVLNAKGAIVARHGEGETVTPEMYAGFGPVVVGTVPTEWVKPGPTGDALTVDALTAAAHLARQIVKAAADAAMSEVSGKYPQAEQVSWGVKLAEAQAVLAGDEAGAIYLADMAKARGMKLKDAAAKVLEKAKAHSALLAKVEADRAIALEAIDKARTVAQVVAAV